MENLNEILMGAANSDVSFTNMLALFALNTTVVWAIIHFLYFRKSHRRDFYFTFILISIAIFFLMFYMIFMLDNLKGKTSIGIGIGLFGIFSIMRYRTDAMPVREMTYLFSIICLSVVNALAAGSTQFTLVVLLPNIALTLAILLCEKLLLSNKEKSKLVQYDRIELITPERHDDLIKDLECRTGLSITNVEVGAIDFLRDMAMIRIFYNSSDNNDNSTINNKLKLSKEEWKNFNDD